MTDADNGSIAITELSTYDTSTWAHYTQQMQYFVDMHKAGEYNKIQYAALHIDTRDFEASILASNTVLHSDRTQGKSEMSAICSVLKNSKILHHDKKRERKIFTLNALTSALETLYEKSGKEANWRCLTIKEMGWSLKYMTCVCIDAEALTFVIFDSDSSLVDTDFLNNVDWCDEIIGAH